MAFLAGRFGGAAAPTFVEVEPWERGFAQIFARDLAPQLAALEASRRITLARGAAAAAMAAALFGLVIIIGVILPWTVPLLAPAPALPLVVGLWLITRFGRGEQRVILPVVCRQFGALEVEVAPKASASALEPYWALGLIRKQRSNKNLELTVRDLITGVHRGIGLRLVEFDAYDDGGGIDKLSMFRGAALELALPDRGPGTSYAPWHFDQAMLARIAEGSAGEPAAGAAMPVTEIGTQAVAGSLSAMAAAFQVGGLSGAVSGNAVYIVMPRGRNHRLLTALSIWSSVYLCEPAIRAALADLAAVFAVLDTMADACGQPAAAAPAAAPFVQTSA